MPGPAPKPRDEVRRRNKPMANTLKLPKAGRQGPPPAYPLGELDEHYAKVWRELWSTPMAVAWELAGYERPVAHYLELTMAGERSLRSGRPSAQLMAELRQAGDQLGMTPISRLRLRWEIDDTDEVAERRQNVRPSSRQRLKAVDPVVVARPD